MRDRTLGGLVFATYARAPSATLFHVDEDRIDVEGEMTPDGSCVPVTVLRDVRLTIGREERVRIAGANGAGKTTLLSALLRGGPSGSHAERVLLLAQELASGEVTRLAGALRALVLDELTNHLDLPSIERLEAALDSYPGCVVLVTHDDAFARATTSRVLRVAGGTVT